MDTNQASEQWSELRQSLKNRWGQLTDEDLRAFENNMNHLVDTIQQKTGDAREVVTQMLQSVFQQTMHQLERAVEATRECSSDAAESVGQTYDRVAENVRAGCHEAEGLVRQRPLESMAISFGAGILTGLVVALLTRNR